MMSTLRNSDGKLFVQQSSVKPEFVWFFAGWNLVVPQERKNLGHFGDSYVGVFRERSSKLVLRVDNHNFPIRFTVVNHREGT